MPQPDCAIAGVATKVMPADKLELLALLEERYQRQRYNQLQRYFPDTGPLRRELYVKHMQFFAAGATARERCFMAANRVGKTEGGGGYEAVLHMTGRYPDWWTGRRFDGPTDGWAAGDTNQTVRDILQKKLLGPLEDLGSGLIPKECIVGIKRRSAMVPDAIETIKVRHVSGGISTTGLKSYEQGRKAFQGTEKDWILLDEEPPGAVYAECLLRLMGIEGSKAPGLMMLTFTPLMGVTEVVLTFLPGGKLGDGQDRPIEAASGKVLVNAGWDDVPHLSEGEKAEMLALMPPHQRDARSKGIPQLGAGAIYPIAEEDIAVDDFQIPSYWPRAYGLDVGWNNTAVPWGAWDPEADILYIYSCYKRGQAEPSVHTDAINTRGKWIPGVCDPAADASGQKDGEKLFQIYRDEHKLQLTKADNAVEAGIYKVFLLMSTGRLKVFKSCRPWFEEFRLYRRDKKGKVVKENDHLMDGTRYLAMSGRAVAKVFVPERKQKLNDVDIDQLPGYGSSIADRM